MGKISVWRTIGQTFSFAFGDYFGILGVVWLPVLLLCAGQYFIMVPIFAHLAGLFQFIAAHPNETVPPEFQSTPRFANALNLLAFLIGAWVTVGVTKEALGTREGPRFVYLSVGWAELRMLGAYLMLIALMIAAAIALFVVGLIVAVIGGSLYAGGALSGFNFHSLSGPGAALAAVIAVALIVALIYYVLRLMFFVAPVTVAEGRFGVWRSWALSKGHAWRIFGIALVLFLILVVAELTLFLAIVLPVVFSVMHSLAHASDHDAPAVVTAVVKTLAPFAPLIVLLVLALMPILYGLQCGASAFAYRALVPKGEEPAR